MQCPNDGAVLTMSERSGIEIDYCPTCRGVWLDRGELDKLIERSLTQPAAAPAPAQQPTQQPTQPHYAQPQHTQPQYAQHQQPAYGQRPYKKRKESWLSELFD